MQFCIPGILTFQANNIVSHSKRAVASAICIIGGGIGGIIASSAFKANESPTYTVSPDVLRPNDVCPSLIEQTGVWVSFAMSIASVVMIVILDIYFWRKNKAAQSETGRNGERDGWLYTL